MPQHAPADALERSILTYGQIYSRNDGLADPFQPCLLETREFLKLFEHVYRSKLPRSTLQLYSSPKFRLLPLPVHKGGFKSYYLNPEHTVRLAVVLHLQKKHYFPLLAIQKVVQDFPEEHYRFILENTLTGEEILDFAFLVREGYSIKDILFRKVSRVLEDIEEPYWQAVEKYGKGADEQHEKFVVQALGKEIKELAGWVKTRRRYDLERVQVGRTEQERNEAIAWQRAMRAAGRGKGRG